MYDELHGEIYSLKHSMSRIQERAENQERYSRRDNVILYNVKGDMNETQSTTCDTVIKLLSENVPSPSRSWSSSDFVRMHRLKTKNLDKQPIILRLYRQSDKLQIIKARDRLRRKGIGVSNDHTQAQREELRDLRTKGKFGVFKNGKLQIDHNKDFMGDKVASSQQAYGNSDSQGDLDLTSSTDRDPRRHSGQSSPQKISGLHNADREGCQLWRTNELKYKFFK